jgi:putative ABC transport system permease protein
LMNSSDLFRMSFNSLRRRKLRTFLTVLGVIIGTSSIIVMLSLGVAMNKNFEEQLSHMGDLTIIEVHSGGGYYPGEQDTRQSSEQVKLDDNAVNSFGQIPGVKGVMPVKNAYLKVVAGRMVGHVPVMGINPEVMEAFDFKVEEGRLLQASDKEAIVFGKQVAYQFYNPRVRNQYMDYRGNPDTPPPVNLINNKLLLTSDMEYGERQRNNPGEEEKKPPKPHEVKGVGILAVSNSEKDYSAYMNINGLQAILDEDRKAQHEDRVRSREDKEQYENVKVKVNDIHVLESVQKQIKDMGFQTFSLTDMLESMKKTSRIIQLVLGGIGAVSLLVAAIGIANTMVMSIYERTREIGIIKVLGAEIKDIQKLFLLEAAMIGLGGGVIGLIFSYLISFILNKIASFMSHMGDATTISVISPGLALAAVAFATLVGIMAGYSPARRAMNLSALDAIRAE